MDPKGCLTLACADGSVFEVDAEAAHYIGLFREMIQAGNSMPTTTKPLEIPASITGPILKKVLDWVHRHKHSPQVLDEAYEISIRESEGFEDQWTDDYFKIDQVTLFAVVNAANFLHIKALLDAACKNIAAMIKGKSVEELRTFFGAPDDLTEAEKAAIAKENEWLVEK